MKIAEPVEQKLAQLEEEYGARAADMPLTAYSELIGIYGAAFAGFLLAASQVRGGLPERMPLVDILVIGIATHKLTRIVARDWVTAPLRAPFTKFKEQAETPGEVIEEPRGEGLQRATGQLVTCPWCLAPWIGGALMLGWLVAPRAVRFVAGVATVVAISDLLNTNYDKLAESS
jgi:hypothetical protein